MPINGDPSSRRADRLIILALVVFAVFFRLATLMMIHTGVDERDYWFSAKALSQGLAYPPLTHRTVRFGVIAPVAAAQFLLGEGPNVYYVLPVLNVAVQAGLAFMMGRRLRGRLCGFLASLALIFFPYMIRSGSQVRPEIFSITYVLASLWCFMVYLERPGTGAKASLLPLAGSALFLFAAYESTVTNLFFAPGLVLLMFARKRPFREILVFCGILLALFLLETGLYASLSRFRFGQLQVIARSHLEGNEALKAMGFLDLFKRYLRPYLQWYWQIPFFAFALSGTYYLVRRGQDQAVILVSAALSFFVLMTFAVKSLAPLVPAEPFINRYFCAVLGPLFLVLSAAFVDVLCVTAGKRARAPAGRATRGGARAYVLSLAIAGLAVAAGFSSPWVPARARPFVHSLLAPADHPLALTMRYRAAADAAWAAREPIVAAQQMSGRDALESCRLYFLSTRNYRPGNPPPQTDAMIDGKPYAVLGSNADLGAAKVLAVVRSPFRLQEITRSSLPALSGEAFTQE